MNGKTNTEQYDLPNEEWRDLVRYPKTKNIIWISNFGRVKRRHKKSFYYSIGTKDSSDGYRKFKIHIFGLKIGNPCIHDLVAESFIRLFDHKKEIVHHLSEKKDQNNLQNLQIMSRAEHMKIHKKGVPRPQSTKQKISQSNKGKVAWNKGIKKNKN